MNKIIVIVIGDEFQSAISVLKKEKRIFRLLSDEETLIDSKVEGYTVRPLSELCEFLSDEIEVIIVGYYWKEKSKQIFYDFGIRSAKVFQWNKKGKSEFFLKDISCVPLFYGFDSKPEDILKESKKQKGFHGRHILFLSYYFPPIGGSPIQRTLKYVKYLSKMGYRITVATVDENNNEYKDPSMLGEVPDNVNILRFSNNFKENETVSLDDQKRIYKLICNIDNSEEFLNLLFEIQKEQIWYPLPDKLILWAVEVFENLDKKIDMSDIDIVYSTVPEWSPHILGYLINKVYGVHWVADYRDPWAVSEEYVRMIYPTITQNEFYWHRCLEKTLIKKMDAIVVMGEYFKELMENDIEYNVDASKIYNIPNGYDEEDFRNIEIKEERNRRFTLCYNGSLGYSRKPQYVLKAICELIHDGYIEKDKISWVFNGPISDERFEDEIKKYDLYNITKFNGMLSHTESISIAANADVMVIYGEYGVIGRFVYTGKFMEYLRFGRPILAFSSENSPISSILEDTGSGKNYLLKDIEGIKSFLMEYYTKWENGDYEKPIFNEKIEQYSREKLTKQLSVIFDKVMM